MKPDKNDDWKASFKYELKCCMFGFLYGFIAVTAFLYLFTKYRVIVIPVCAILFIAVLIWNIRSVKFSIKALLIELPIAIGSFWIWYILWIMSWEYPIISID